MADKNKTTENKRNNSSPQPPEVIKAHTEADKDMEKDPDLTSDPGPAADLDEGELARFEGED